VTAPEEVMPFSLFQNYPNPFRDNTYFKFKLMEPVRVTLSVYDIYGRTVSTMIDNEYLARGKYVRSFDARSHRLSPGVYWFVLSHGNLVQKRKMLLIE
jgi:hypothetical protein